MTFRAPDPIPMERHDAYLTRVVKAVEDYVNETLDRLLAPADEAIEVTIRWNADCTRVGTDRDEAK